jgi:hypothetical protein
LFQFQRLCLRLLQLWSSPLRPQPDPTSGSKYAVVNAAAVGSPGVKIGPVPVLIQLALSVLLAACSLAASVARSAADFAVATVATVAFIFPEDPRYNDKASVFRSHAAPSIFAHSWCGGAGVGDLGLQRAGAVFTRACEMDENCRRSYHAQFGIRPCPDFLTMPLAAEGSADVVLITLPCVSFSVAGLQQGTKGPPGSAAHAAGDLLTCCFWRLRMERPRSFIFENVAGLLLSNDGMHKDLSYVLQGLSSAGYDCKHGVEGSSDSGRAMRRSRLLIVGLRSDLVQMSSWSVSDISASWSMQRAGVSTRRCVSDIMNHQLSREERLADGAIFIPKANITFESDSLPACLPSGPEFGRPFVRVAPDQVPFPDRASTIHTFAIGTIGAPSLKKRRRNGSSAWLRAPLCLRRASRAGKIASGCHGVIGIPRSPLRSSVLFGVWAQWRWLLALVVLLNLQMVSTLPSPRAWAIGCSASWTLWCATMLF